MNEKMIQRMRNRTKQFLAKLENLFFRDPQPLQAEFCRYPGAVPFEDRKKGRFQPIHTGEQFGEKWDNAWFHITGSVPEEWKGRKTALRLNLGGETLVFDEKGVPFLGLTSSSVFFKKYCKEYLFLDEQYQEKIDLWCETIAMTLVGQASGSGTGICSHLEVGWIDEELLKLKYDFQIAVGISEIDNSARSLRALHVLDEGVLPDGNQH